jgi:hypothetical protein
MKPIARTGRLCRWPGCGHGGELVEIRLDLGPLNLTCSPFS